MKLFFNACAQLGTPDALDTMKNFAMNMTETDRANPNILTNLFNTLVKCGDCSTAEIIFSKIKRTLIDYGNLMNGFNKEDRPEKTLKLFDQMKIDSIEPDIIIYLSVIKALSEIGIFELSETIIEQMPKSFLIDNKIRVALVDMWVSFNKFVRFLILKTLIRAKWV